MNDGRVLTKGVLLFVDRTIVPFSSIEINSEGSEKITRFLRGTHAYEMKMPEAFSYKEGE
ncbi:MAG: hypothetical protein BWY93_00743 [Euryarchaeota archaeon ADurb.BinA087]|nr:MAG: hypothetical protein BWY93_00743 [Euryarchaeota archaeon ADurb.BinA087]